MKHGFNFKPEAWECLISFFVSICLDLDEKPAFVSSVSHFFFNYFIILYFFLCMQIILFKRHYVLFKYCLQDSQLFYSEKILKIGHRLGLVACKVYWEYGLGLNFGWFIMPIEESTLALIIIILLNYSAHSSLYLEVTGFCFNI